MSNKKDKNIIKENVVQAIVVADTFEDEFLPISNDIPLSLLPLTNKPLIDYTLEFLSLGGIEETFLFCCNHIDAVKAHINKCVQNCAEWTLTMKVNIIASETCRSFGDCLRDLDAKGLLRGDFVLVEPGTVSNIELLPLLKKHNTITKTDKGAAMTLIFQEAGVGYYGRCPYEEVLLAANANNRVLYHKKLGKTRDRRVNFPLEIFLENAEVSLKYNLKDTHIAICSPSVLPLFSDNFDFQTKDDFVRGLLINEEILGSTIYYQVLEGSQYGGAVSNWRMYHVLSRELLSRWIYPLVPCPKTNKLLKDQESAISKKNVKLGKNVKLYRAIIGDNVKLGDNVVIENSFVLANSKIGNKVMITNSVVGPDCIIQDESKITVGSILGKGVELKAGLLIENTMVQSTKPDFCDDQDKLGEKAYRLKLDEDEEDNDIIGKVLSKKLSKMHIDETHIETDAEYDFSDEDDDESSVADSIPDDTKLFLSEVIDSLTRGFEDGLLCDNLILEINSSRYAYNVTVKEVNFNVIKAILTLSLRQQFGPQYFQYFTKLLTYFTPILKNYIRNKDAMIDCLQAIQDIATSHSDKITDKWLIFLLQHIYDNDYVSEDVILEWASKLEKSEKLYSQVQPFVNWLEEAEEESD